VKRAPCARKFQWSPFLQIVLGKSTGPLGAPLVMFWPIELHWVSTSLIAGEELQILVVRSVQPRDAEDAFPTPWVGLRNPVRRVEQDKWAPILQRQHADRAVKGPLPGGPPDFVITGEGLDWRGQPLPMDQVLADNVVPVVLRPSDRPRSAGEGGSEAASGSEA
jgi:hypothetical protein